MLPYPTKPDGSPDFQAWARRIVASRKPKPKPRRATPAPARRTASRPQKRNTK